MGTPKKIRSRTGPLPTRRRRQKEGEEPDKPLTPRQARFVAEYLVDLNGTKAAIRAGYSPNGADVHAARLLGNARIAAAVAEGQAKRLQKIELKSDAILRELLRLAMSDTRKLYHEDGSLKLPHEWDDDTAAAVSGVEVVETNIGELATKMTKKVRLWDKKGALELLGKHLVLFREHIEHSGSLDLTAAGERIDSLMARLATAKGAGEVPRDAE